jgi:trans-aconitate 2-methyltransferase
LDCGKISLMADPWNPDQYQRFQAERSAPFFDLLNLLAPSPGGSVLDLGCGTGELTAKMHQRLQAASTIGLDSSSAMLQRAADLDTQGVTFRHGDLETFCEPESYDVIASNAALHWVGDHPSVLGRWTASLRPGGQLAVQVPANVDHPSHYLSAQLAASDEFVELFDGAPPRDPVLSVLEPASYAELLNRLGFEQQHVRLQVYPHRLESTAAVVEWVRGTSLTRFERVLSPADFDRFLDRYRERLLSTLGDQSPYFYGFKRILLWGRLPG